MQGVGFSISAHQNVSDESVTSWLQRQIDFGHEQLKVQKDANSQTVQAARTKAVGEVVAALVVAHPKATQRQVSDWIAAVKADFAKP